MSELDDRNLWLTTAIRALADDDADPGASAGVESVLLAEVRRIRTARRRPWIAAGVAASALLAVGTFVSWRERPGPATTIVAPSIPVADQEVATGFFPLLYSDVPATDARIVRLEVPRAALTRFGLADGRPLDESSSGRVLADVLVGEDGLARAVRFVNPVGDQEALR